MFELRTYTLASDEALDQYASVHWARHVVSLSKFGIITHYVWKQVRTDKPRLIVLVEYADGADPLEIASTYMASSEFRADMDGFSMADIVHVSSALVEPAQT